MFYFLYMWIDVRIQLYHRQLGDLIFMRRNIKLFIFLRPQFNCLLIKVYCVELTLESTGDFIQLLTILEVLFDFCKISPNSTLLIIIYNYKTMKHFRL